MMLTSGMHAHVQGRTDAASRPSLWQALKASVIAPGQARQSASAASQRRQCELEAQVAALHRVQAVIEFDLDGTILQANDNFLQAVGYRLDEIQGRHHAMFVEPALAQGQEYRDFWARLGRGEFDAGQYRRLARAAARSGSRPPTTRCWTATGVPTRW